MKLFYLLILIPVLIQAQTIDNCLTYTKIDLDNPAPNAKTICRLLKAGIGDSKTTDFVPRLSVSAWNDECKLVIDLQSQKPKDKVNNTELKYISASDLEIEIDRNEKHKIYKRTDGNLEWEIILDTIPDNNVFSYRIQTTGLKFVYQDTALISEEIRKNSIFPDSAVYSWIAYHNSKSNNHIHIGNNNDTTYENYYGGIAFTIFRPKAIAADGAEIWCQLDIDTINQKMDIVVPSEFIENATYPVIIDPTIGNTTAEGFYGNVTNWMTIGLYALYDAPDANGALSKGLAYSYRGDANNACSLRTFVYDYSTTLSECDLIASSDSIALVNTGSTNIQWNEMSFDSETISSGTDYFAAFKGMSEGNYSLRVAYGVSSWGDIKWVSGIDWSGASTFSGASLSSEKWLVYFEFTTTESNSFLNRRRKLAEKNLIGGS